MASGERQTRGKRRGGLRPRPREKGAVPTLRRSSSKFNCSHPLPPAPPQRQTGCARGAWFRTRTGVGGRETPPHTHPPPKLRQRKLESGAKPLEGRGRYSLGVAGLEQVRGRGHRWRPRSGHRASGRLGHLPQQRGAWMREQRGRGAGRWARRI